MSNYGEELARRFAGKRLAVFLDYDRTLTPIRDRPQDAVLLFYLFRQDELKQIFERLGYAYTPETLRKTVAYYDARTSHGSTLSFVAYAGVYAELDLATSWERSVKVGVGDRVREIRPGESCTFDL